MAHDLLSPSSAVTWANCPGAIALISEMPIVEESSTYAEEGTQAHIQAEHAACAAFRGGIYTPTTDDAEMVRHARGWADCLLRNVNRKQLVFWAAERTLDISSVTRREGAHGTADFVAIDVDGTLTIADFKYGMGVEVDAHKNLQLTIYALAAINEFYDICDINSVRLVVYQPRISSEEKTYVWDMNELRAFCRHLQSAAELATSLIGDREGATTALRPGENQCRFCKAKPVCPALRAKTKDLIARDFDVIDAPAAKESIPVPQEPDQIARALPWLDAIENWCDAVRAHALNLASTGIPVPGYKVVAGKRGARKWTPEAEAKLASMRINRSALYKKTLVTPTQAEKLAKDGLIGPRQWRAISEFITQAEGKPTLAPESDKRPAISVALKDEFSIID